MDRPADEMDQEEIRLDRYFAAVWRAKWLVLIAILAATALAAFLGSRQPTLHTATAQLRIGRVWKEPLEDPYITEKSINGTGFFKELAPKLGLKPNQLKRSIRADVELAGPRKGRYALLVNINATTDNAEESARLAQAVADEIIARHERLFNEALAPHQERERVIERRLKEPAVQASRELAFKLEDELGEIRSNNSTPTVTEKTHLVDSDLAASSTRPSMLRSVATTALAAAIAAVVIAALVEHFRPAAKRAAAGNQK